MLMMVVVIFIFLLLLLLYRLFWPYERMSSRTAAILQILIHIMCFMISFPIVLSSWVAYNEPEFYNNIVDVVLFKLILLSFGVYYCITLYSMVAEIYWQTRGNWSRVHVVRHMPFAPFFTGIVVFLIWLFKDISLSLSSTMTTII
jgi:hypothetical protein